QAAGFDAHERVALRIEIGGLVEDLDGDRIALQAIGVAGQALLDDVAQELRRASGLLEAAAAQDPSELGCDFVACGPVRVCAVGACGRLVRHRATDRLCANESCRSRRRGPWASVRASVTQSTRVD